MTKAHTPAIRPGVRPLLFLGRIGCEIDATTPRRGGSGVKPAQLNRQLIEGSETRPVRRRRPVRS